MEKVFPSYKRVGEGERKKGRERGGREKEREEETDRSLQVLVNAERRL